VYLYIRRGRAVDSVKEFELIAAYRIVDLFAARVFDGEI
jgi:hypothetical protein